MEITKVEPQYEDGENSYWITARILLTKEQMSKLVLKQKCDEIEFLEMKDILEGENDDPKDN